MRTRSLFAALLCFGVAPLVAQDLVVDAHRNCLYLGQTADIAQKAVVLNLAFGATYEVTVSGAAFMTQETGAQADPFPGVIVAYEEVGEDGWAQRYRIMRPGDTLEFRTPTGTGQFIPHLIAFFVDPNLEAARPNTGSYTLRVTRK